MNAWLITWEWNSDPAAVADKIAGVLDPRRSSSFVLDFVEYLYAHATSDVAELRSYASHRKHNPCRARYQQIGGLTYADRIQCGAHPWLDARLVSEFEVTCHPETHLETMTWIEPPLMQWSDDHGGLIEVLPRERGRVTRFVRGALRRDPVWDRSIGGFKPEYEGLFNQARRGQRCMLEALLGYVRDGERVCPVPDRWNELWELLPDRWRSHSGWEQAPPPLILSAWRASSNWEKITRLQEHIGWAAEQGILMEADAFLRGLPESAWHHFGH